MVKVLRKAKVFFFNGIILTITSLIMRGAGLIFQIYVSNKIGTEAVGLFSLIMSVYMFAITIATSGINIAATCIISEELAKNNYRGIINASKKCNSFSLILGIVSALFILILSPTIASLWLHGKVSPIPLFFISIGLPFIAISSSLNGYFSATRKAYKTASSQFIELSIKIISTVLLLKIFINGGVEYICIALIGADVISEVFSFIYLYILYKIDRRKYLNIDRFLDFSYSKKIIKISFPIAITSYVRSGLSTIKQFLIPLRLEKSGLSCSMALSSYGIITGMVLPVIMFPSTFINSFSSLLIPEFSCYLAQNNTKGIAFISKKIFFLTSIFSICIASVFILFSNEISLVVYQNLESAKYIKILAPLVFFMYMDSVIDSILKGLNQQVSVMCCNIADLIISISLLYFLLPICGINGYIIVIFISEILNFTISILQLYKIANFKFLIFSWLIKPIFACFLSFSIINIVNVNYTSNVTINLIFKIMLYIIVYLLLTVLLYKKNFKSFKI